MVKEKERYIFQRFKELYPNFPPSDFVYQDSPDVILNTDNSKKIGVEITEAIYDQEFMKKSEFQIKFNENVLEKVEKNIPFKFSLSIRLHETKLISSSNYDRIINEVVDVCYEEFLDLDNLQRKEVSNLGSTQEFPEHVKEILYNQGYRSLPLGVKSIRLGRNDTINKSYHPKHKTGWVPNFQPEFLDTILLKKHKALEKYQPCDQQWLVIGEAFDFVSYFDNINIPTPVISKFDKIFLVRNWENVVLALK